MAIGGQPEHGLLLKKVRRLCQCDLGGAAASRRTRWVTVREGRSEAGVWLRLHARYDRAWAEERGTAGTVPPEAAVARLAACAASPEHPGEAGEALGEGRPVAAAPPNPSLRSALRSCCTKVKARPPQRCPVPRRDPATTRHGEIGALSAGSRTRCAH